MDTKAIEELIAIMDKAELTAPVSYTHLTLPTMM